MDISKMSGSDLRYSISVIKSKMYVGDISIEDAIVIAEPYIYEINERGKAIAKEYGKKFHPITFTNISR